MITAEHLTGSCGDCGSPIAEWNKSGYCRNHRNVHRPKGYNRKYEAGRRARQPEASTLRNARQRAKQEGVPATLTLATMPPIPANCPCCGRDLIRGGNWHNQPSLDRIIPSLGYVPGNVQWLCRRCNQIKSNASPEELMRVALFVNGRAA